MPKSIYRTKLEVRAERILGKPLGETLPEYVRQVGIEAAGKRVKVSRHTITYWLNKLGYSREWGIVGPDEYATVMRVPSVEAEAEEVGGEGVEGVEDSEEECPDVSW